MGSEATTDTSAQGSGQPGRQPPGQSWGLDLRWRSRAQAHGTCQDEQRRPRQSLLCPLLPHPLVQILTLAVSPSVEADSRSVLSKSHWNIHTPRRHLCPRRVPRAQRLQWLGRGSAIQGLRWQSSLFATQPPCWNLPGILSEESPGSSLLLVSGGSQDPGRFQ